MVAVLSLRSVAFEACEPLLAGVAPRGCHACVVVPARNEERGLPFCLDALRRQVDLDGNDVPAGSYEILLLLNNCTDASAEVTRRWCARNQASTVHVIERHLPEPHAHVGMARALLMDTAWQRLTRLSAHAGAILSTDADTVVAEDWLAQNLRALASGADVVGGAVELSGAELREMPAKLRRCYEQDRRYASLIAQLEDALDPQEGDPWPRHLDHFGSSLACTPEAYALAGGMPAVTPLEDEAFVDRVRRAGLRLRHEPRVRVSTSARLQGRAERGMAGQLRSWAEISNAEAHLVTSTSFLAHRFRTLRALRTVFATKDCREIGPREAWWRETFSEALHREQTCPAFLAAVDCDALISATFVELGPDAIQEPIGEAIQKLRAHIELSGEREAGVSFAGVRSRETMRPG